MTLRLVLLAAFLSVFALDFRGIEDGGIAFQFALLILCVGGWTGFVLLSRRPLLEFLERRNAARLLALLWIWFISLGLLQALVGDVPWERASRIALPHMLFLAAFIAVTIFLRDRNRSGDVLNTLLIAGLVSAFWRLAYALYVHEIPILELRYQGLSPAVSFLLAYGFGGITITRTRRAFGLFVLGLALALIGISLTRSFLISIGFIVIGWLTLPRDIRAEPLLHGKSDAASRLTSVTTAILLGLIGAMTLRSGLLEDWVARLFHTPELTDVDLTLATRYAEIAGQYGKLTNSITNLLAGLGFGADYDWDMPFDETLSTLMSGETSQDLWATGHNAWFYPFFLGGLLGGWIVPWTQLYLLFRLRGSLNRSSEFRLSQRRTQALLLLIWVAYLGQSFTAYPLGERFGAVTLGALAALVIVNTRSKTKQTSVHVAASA